MISSMTWVKQKKAGNMCCVWKECQMLRKRFILFARWPLSMNTSKILKGNYEGEIQLTPDQPAKRHPSKNQIPPPPQY